MKSDGYFDFEKLDVYKAAMAFRSLVPKLTPPRGHAELRDQIERGSISIVANIAEGAGKTSRDDKKKYYESAKGSASEMGALVEIARTTGNTSNETYDEARSLLLRCVQMLSRLAGQPRA